MTAVDDHQRLFALEPDLVACPHPVFARMRESAPVTWVGEIESWVVTRYDDVAAVLRQPDRFSSAEVTGPILARQIQTGVGRLLRGEDDDVRSALERVNRGRMPVLLSADRPLHGRQRNLVNRSFTQRQVRSAETSIRQLAEELVASFPDDRVEVVSAFAVPFPLSVIADRLGVPRDRLADFKRWSDDFTVAIGNHHLDDDQLRAMLVSQGEFFAYFEELVVARRAEPTDDLVSEVANATLPDGDALSSAEILGMLNQFLVAGNETTTKLLAASALRIATEPGLADRLRADPALLDPFVEELLRLEAPVQGLFRRAVVDSVVGGVDIPAGANLWLAYASANRDVEAFDRPDDLDLGRASTRPHLAFGFGEHFCLGAALARAEARIGVGVLLEQLDDLAPAPDNTFPYVASYALHGLEELWLTYRRRPT